jgi:hypothetical protein
MLVLFTRLRIEFGGRRSLILCVRWDDILWQVELEARWWD